MRNLKIKFFIAGHSFGVETPKLLKKWNKISLNNDSLRQIGGFPNRYHFIPTYWFLKTFYKIYGKYNDKIVWLPCEHDTKLNTEYVLDLINREKPDVLCFGFYTWSESTYVRLITEIKKIYSDIVIIGGGPGIREEEPLNVVDFAIYGDGEEAFTILLDNLIENKSDFTEVPNLIYKEKNQVITNPFKIFKYEKFDLPSPYLDNKEEIKLSVEKIKNKYNSNLSPSIGWEITRGCPYACSFCDWSSGLHHKITSRKNNNWKIELDFFVSELKCPILIHEANFGIMKYDSEIINYLLEKYPDELDFPMLCINWDKLHKDRVYKLIDKILIYYPNYPIKISLQDINEDILETINRPEIPWEEHKQHILNLRSNHPNCFIILELIMGLPKQTINSWLEMLFELDSTIKPSWFILSWWQLLTNSPAYDKEYQDKHNLTTQNVKDLKEIDLVLNNSTILDNYIDKHQIWDEYTMVHENHPDELWNMLYKMATISVYNGILINNPDITTNCYKETYLKCKNSLTKFINGQYKLMMSTKREDITYIYINYENSLSNFRTFFHRPDIITKLMENTI